MIRIEKRGLNTAQVVADLARALGVGERDVGVAGLKDRRAVTRQWLSLPPPVTPEAALAVTLPGVTILEAIRHGHKLRTGHVRANRFRLRVRGVTAPERARGDAAAILTALAAAPGAPNWYGEQRFGRDGDNAARGRALVSGERRLGRGPRARRLDRLMVSALQSSLFNAWLVARLEDGLFREVLVGDLLHKPGAGQFVCEDAATDTARLRAGELVLTGPMFGERMRRPPEGTPAAAREAAILAAAGLAPGAFAAVRAIAEGTRRDATILLADTAIAAVADDPAAIEIAFTLPGGAYATIVMRELMKVSPLDAPRPDERARSQEPTVAEGEDADGADGGESDGAG
jgi:tRNA pseudouridine13 synthase